MGTYIYFTTISSNIRNDELHSCAYILCYIGSKHKTLNFYSLFSIIIEKQWWTFLFKK